MLRLGLEEARGVEAARPRDAPGLHGDLAGALEAARARETRLKGRHNGRVPIGNDVGARGPRDVLHAAAAPARAPRCACWRREPGALHPGPHPFPLPTQGQLQLRPCSKGQRVKRRGRAARRRARAGPAGRRRALAPRPRPQLSTTRACPGAALRAAASGVRPPPSGQASVSVIRPRAGRGGASRARGLTGTGAGQGPQAKFRRGAEGGASLCAPRALPVPQRALPPRHDPRQTRAGAPCPCRCRASSWAAPPRSHPHPRPRPPRPSALRGGEVGFGRARGWIISRRSTPPPQKHAPPALPQAAAPSGGPPSPLPPPPGARLLGRRLLLAPRGLDLGLLHLLKLGAHLLLRGEGSGWLAAVGGGSRHAGATRRRATPGARRGRGFRGSVPPTNPRPSPTASSSSRSSKPSRFSIDPTLAIRRSVQQVLGVAGGEGVRG
jgi:hypothetical protein